MPRCSVPKCSKFGSHRFPRDENYKQLWLQAIRRPDFKPSKDTRICSKHFLPEDYELIGKDTGLCHQRRHLKQGMVPSVFPWKKQIVTLKLECDDSDSSLRHSDKKALDSEMEDPLIVTEKAKNYNLSSQTSERLRLLTTETMFADDESVYYFTGLENRTKYEFVLSTLLPMANNIKYHWKTDISLAVEDQFLLLLLKFRRNYPELEISKIFGLSEAEVKTILLTWINFVSGIWSLIDVSPKKELLKFYMSRHVCSKKVDERNTIEKPTQPDLQNVHENTLIYVVAGQKKAVQKEKKISGLVEAVIPKQFNQPDTLIGSCNTENHKNTLVYVVSRGKLRIREPLVKYEKEVSQHKKQIVNSTKIYKILLDELDQSYKPLASEIFFICFMLCTFKESGVNESK